MSSLRSRWVGLSALWLAVATLSACGGGEDPAATGAAASPAPGPSGSASAPAPAASPSPSPAPAGSPTPVVPGVPDDYTASDFDDCPAEVSSAGWETLTCMTGKFKGTVLEAPTQTCSVSVRSDGWVSVEIDGQTLTHQVPSNAEVAQGLGGASYLWQDAKANPFQAFASKRTGPSGQDSSSFSLDRYPDGGDGGSVFRLEARITGSDKTCETSLRLPDVTGAQLRSCPQATIKPFNIASLSCLVGVYRGQRLDRAGQPTGGQCEMSIFKDGTLRAFSPDPYEYIALPLGEPNGDYTVASEYVGSGAGGASWLSWTSHHQTALNDRVTSTVTSTAAGMVVEWLYTATNADYHDGVDSYMRCKTRPLP